MNITLCTLFEGNYHFGVAALTNSLVAAGYSGEVWVGYRGVLPEWITASRCFDRGTGQMRVTPTLTLCLVELATAVHFTYYKPTFIREVLERHAPAATVVAYIDPDIVVKCDWSAMKGWFTEDGISLVEDVNGSMPVLKFLVAASLLRDRASAGCIACLEDLGASWFASARYVR